MRWQSAARAGEKYVFISQGVSKEIVSSTPTPLMKLNRRPAATGESLFTLRGGVLALYSIIALKLN
jgi:hypothetical protein